MNTVVAAELAGTSVQAVAATQSSEPPVDREQHPSGIVPVLQNIVATVNLSCKLDLKAIALKARNAEYNPKVCSCLSCTASIAGSCSQTEVVLCCSDLLLLSSELGILRQLRWYLPLGKW